MTGKYKVAVMAKEPSESKQQTDSPAPEVLQPRAKEAPAAVDAAAAAEAKPAKHLRRATYRPSHKATFISLAVVVVILAFNAGIITFVLKSQNKKSQGPTFDQGSVTLSSDVLNKVGVNRLADGEQGVQLVVNPNAKFNGTLTVAGDTSIGGALKLNSTFSASNASLTQLQAGDTSLQKLSVNGDTSLSTLALRNDLSVTGASHFQGATTFSQLTTVNNNLNVAGSVAIGGMLSVNQFHASALVSDTTLTIGGHVITAGLSPGVSAGPALGSLATVGISGNDASGTISVNTGVAGGGGGAIATVTFHQRFATTPHVVVTPSANVGSVWVTRSSSGFTLYVSGSMPAGGYVFDYIIEQ